MIGRILSCITRCIPGLANGKILSRTPACEEGGTRESEPGSMKARSSDWRVILKSLNTGKTGRIVLKAGSNKLYYDFCYDGKRYEKTTGLQFSVENALQARKTLDDMMGEIQAGTFCFASRFPYASPVSLTLHTQQESRSKAKRPDQITIAEFINGTHDYDGWLKVTLPRFDKKQQSDYERDIRYWLVPLYGHLTFAELTGDKLHSSLSDYKRFKMENGPLLSGIRIKNIFTPLRLILRSASSKYGWRDLEDPFEYLTENNFGPKRKENPTPALLFTEFVKLRMHLNDYDQRITDMKALTGMIDSEMSGLRKTDIFFDAAKPYLHIRNKVVNCIESDELKTEFRERQMHITRRLKKELECFMAQSPDNYVFTKPNGTRYLGEDFRKAWAKAFKAEGMKYIRPYCLRHSFAGWSKIVGIELSWLQDMMGHGSLQMLYKRYGRHKFGLEDDRESIIEFFGMDYLRLGNASAANLFAKDAKDEYQRPREGKKKAA